MKTLVLYLGNPIVRNDQVGFIIGRRLKTSFRNMRDLEFGEFTGSPLEFISRIDGCKNLIIIDSVSTGRYALGSVVLFSREKLLEGGSACTLHGMNLPDALASAERFGIDLPSRIHLIGIESGSIDRFGSSCDPALSVRFAEIGKSVTAILTRLIESTAEVASSGFHEVSEGIQFRL